jgi:hypothetical protein
MGLRFAWILALVGCSSASGAPETPEPDAEAPPAGEDAGTDAPAADAAPADATTTTEGGGDAATAFAVRVDGNRLVDGAGKPMRLVGVDHSGSEYACVQGYGIFDSPHDDALAKSIASWHVNAVRVPLNEDCWLAINGIKPQYSGQTYQAAIVDWVKTLHAHGLYAILELHWNAPGTNPSKGQLPMADVDHAPTFWAEVATAFAADPAVVFDLYNEPYIDTQNADTQDPWTCWRDGCTIKAGAGIPADWAGTGMQALVDAVRGTGATNVIMAGGLAYANDLSGWIAHAPNDPKKQLAASFHLYNFNTCKTQACWDGQIAPVAAEVPLVTGEIGENDCGHGFIDGYMAWADAHGISYLGWTFNPWDCATGPALVTDFAGTPTAFGQGYRDHVLTLFP